MAWRTTKHTMGVQNNGEDTNKRDAISANRRVRSGHSSRGRTHMLQGGQSRWKQERRGTCLQLDLVDEVRATTEQRLARYQNCMAKHYNSRVRYKDLQVGDLVLRKVMGTARDPTHGKLSSNWEAPYRIMLWQRKDTYHLETLDGRRLHYPWNVEHLQKYY